MAVSSGEANCIVQGFHSMNVSNEYSCPFLELSKTIFTTSSLNIQRPVCIVHECTSTCVFQDSTASRTIEREDFASTTLVFVHDLHAEQYVLFKCFLCINFDLLNISL